MIAALHATVYSYIFGIEAYDKVTVLLSVHV